MKTQNQILDEYKLNWEVRKMPLVFVDETDNGKYHPTDSFGLVRMDNHLSLGVCKKDYVPFQNEVVLNTLMLFGKEHGLEITNGGMFNNGRKIFFQLKINEKLKIGRDNVEQYVFAANSFDKTVQLSFGYTNIVVSCQNSFNRMLSTNVKYKFKHVTGSTTKVLELPNIFEQHFNMRKETNEMFRQWTDIKLPQGIIDDLIMYLLNTDRVPTDEEKGEISTRKLGIFKDIQESIAKEITEKGDNLWGLFNGVTYYANHVRVTKNRENARQESVLIGTGNRIMTQALDKIEKYAEELV